MFFNYVGPFISWYFVYCDVTFNFVIETPRGKRFQNLALTVLLPRDKIQPQQIYCFLR